MLSASCAIEKNGNGIANFRAGGQDDHWLEGALSRVPREIAATGAKFRIVVEGNARPFRSAVLEDVYRIAHEALLNAFRHSQASNVEAELHFAAHYFGMLIRDNGRGVDTCRLSRRNSRRGGLLGMSERSQRMGARFKVMSGAALGTEIQFWLPGEVAFASPDRNILTKYLPSLFRRQEGRSKGFQRESPFRFRHAWIRALVSILL
jgi:nitrate/nitrite-specific signal transduction histidine kinase